MFFTSPLFWFVMGTLFLVVAWGFKAQADDWGWQLNWWKGLLALLWYGLICVSLYAGFTMIGENEVQAGIWIMGVGLFVALVLGVGLWRVLSLKQRI